MKFSPAPWSFDAQFLAKPEPVTVNGVKMTPDPFLCGRTIRDANRVWTGEAAGPHVGVPQDCVLGNAILMSHAPAMYALLQQLSQPHPELIARAHRVSAMKLLAEMQAAAIPAEDKAA